MARVGREPWERSEAGGVNDNERLEFHGGVTTVKDERGPGLDFSLCFVCAAVVCKGLPL